MIRLLIACVLGLALFGYIAWQFDLIPLADTTGNTSTKGGKKGQKIQADLGADLYPSANPTPDNLLERQDPIQRERDPIVVTGNLTAIFKADVASQISGQLLFVGEEIPEGAMQTAGVAAFLAAPYYFAEVNHGARPIIKPYRLLTEGDMVYANQVLAMVDTAKALGELDMKQVKVTAAKAESDGARLIAAEADIKLRTAGSQLNSNSIAMEEYRSAKLTMEKMYQDSISKGEGYKQSIKELEMAQTIYRQHEIRNKSIGQRGVIQKVYRQQSEAVKELEPVMQLMTLDPLGADAQVDGEYSRRISDGKKVTVVPTIVDPPLKTYYGHVSAVNCLAVTKDQKDPLIVSGGEDGTVFVWKRFQTTPDREFKHINEPVKSLVCSPPGAARNLVLAGFIDGTIRLYDLDSKETGPIMEARKHDVTVGALAFSPDGKYFASGAADGSIILWNAKTFEPHYAFDEKHGVSDPHHADVTSLHFTPQSKLVSASLDKSLRVWSLKEKGASLDYHPLTGRNANIGQINISSDGRWLLFDQGKTLQILRVQDGRIVTPPFQNPGGVIPFDTLALFSPDNTMALTAGAPDGKLQLWHVPAAGERGFEIRQLATKEHVPVSCAAFAPRKDYNGKGTFAVSANMEGQIYRWDLPSPEEIKNHPIRNLPVRFNDGGLNASTRQRNIRVEVPNPPTDEYPKGRLEPGRPVTIWID